MSSIASRLIKAAPKSKACIVNQTDIGEKTTLAKYIIPLMNLMFSGSFNGGLCFGIHQLVGDSRTFKTNMAVMMAKGYLDYNKDYDPSDLEKQPVVVVFDSEFAIRPTLKQFGISDDQIVYVPFENLEELKETLTQIIADVKRGEKVFFLVDSISQVASIKEVADALKGDTKVDMTRAKEMNSLFRIITPMLAIRDLPLVAINSFYEDNANQYADPIIKGGKQNFLSSDIIWFVSRAQDKDDEGLKGWFFNYKALKHRFVKEKSVFKLHVTFDGGIDWASGLIELGVESKLIKQAGAWYELADELKTPELSKKFQRKQIVNKGESGFLEALLASPKFHEFCEDKYRLENGEMVSEDLVEA